MIGGSVKTALPTPAAGCHLDGVGKSGDHFRQFDCLSRREHPPPDRRDNRLHRGGEISWHAHRRKRERNQPLSVRRDHTVETEPQRCRVAAEGELDSLPGQGLGLALQQQLGGPVRSVATSAWTALRITGVALLERASPLFCCFCRKSSATINLYSAEIP